jgi:carbon-monoxide dehydrogenase medium subunit
MRPSRFNYIKAESVAHALDLLAGADGDAKLLAGGQSLVPMMNFRVAAPACLIDINGLGELDFIRRDGALLRIGSMTRHDRLARSEVARDAWPLIAQAYEFVAHQTVRNRGTIGGNLAHADPSSEMPAVMLALDARMMLQSLAGKREVTADAFFDDMFSTALRPDELLTEIAIPVPQRPYRSGFLEVSPRQGDFALCGIAVAMQLDDGRCADVRIACCGATARPLRMTAVERWLEGRRLDRQDCNEAGARAAAGIEPLSDAKASAAYRKTLIQALLSRVLTQVASLDQPLVEMTS